MKAIKKAGYEEPTPVQAGVIPVALMETDVLGQARTGTGKTASFVIPVLECIPIDDAAKTPFALVLVPTRELALQVLTEFEKLAFALPVRSVALYGGQPIRGQMAKLRRGVDVVVGTPGRILDLIGRRNLDTSDIGIVVLDEADRMLDIGFRPDIEKILRQCPKERQTLLLSATLPDPILRLAQRYMVDPVTLNFSDDDIAVETIDQYYYTVDQDRKYELLTRLLEREEPTQTIIFCRTKRRTEWLHLDLKKQFEGVGCMHGDMAQSQRNRMMADFRAGKIKVLCATDVVGRGIDISGISHIVNYDVPQDCDDYVHRVGRTGRMGREGVAFTFATMAERNELDKIEKRIAKQLKLGELFDDFHLSKVNALKEEQGAPPQMDRGGRSTKKYRRRL